MFDFFYKRPYLLWAVILGMFVFGVIGLVKMPKNLFPDANRPEVVIFTSMPGASAEVVASQISKPIEEEMATLSHIYEIKSTNVPNFSIVHVVFDYTKTLSQAAVDVNNALARLGEKLPSIAKPAVYLVGDFTLPVDVFAVSSKELPLSDVRKIVQSYIRPKLLANSEISNVEIFGGYTSALKVHIDPMALAKYRLSFAKVLQTVAQNIKDMPAGFLKDKHHFITLTFYGQKASVQKIANLSITPNLKLKNIATVSWDHETSNSAYLGNGSPAIAVSVQRAPGGNVLATSNAARAIMKEVAKAYPKLSIQVADTQRNLIKTSNTNMLEALRDAVIYTLLVILIFLANFRAILAAALSIPMVFFGTIAFLYLTGQGLNIVIYTAIILALGMLTDDAVVVLENIERHLEEGEEMQKAVYEGTKEVLKPVLAGTVATIAIIFPLMFVGGFPQKIFRPLIETVIVALIISYFLSVTFIPKLSFYLYKNGTQKSRFERFLERVYQQTFGRLAKLYMAILSFTNKKPLFLHRFPLMAAAVLTLVITLRIVMPLIGRDVMPPMDTGIIKANVEFSSNVSSNESAMRLQPFVQWLHNQPWLESSSIAIGTEKGVLSVGGDGGGNSVAMTILAVDRFHRKKSIWQLEEQIREQLAKLQGVKDMAVFDFGATALSTIKAPLSVEFRSDSYAQLPDRAVAALRILQNVKGLTSLKTSWDRDFQEIELVIDRQKALDYGLTPVQVLSQLVISDRVAAMDSAFASMSVQPVVLQLTTKNYESLRTLPIATKKGFIPLEAIATIKPHFTFSKIERYDLLYAIDVEGYRATRPVSKITEDADRLLQSHGINRYVHTGDIVQLKDSFKRIIKAIAIGIVILILVLMVIYESLRLALVMILVLPLAMIGAGWAMLIAHKPSCMPSMVGLLLLFGIIIKNAVLLIDFYKDFRTKESPFEAAKEAIRVRFRPVFMTAFGTIAGMVPIALEQAVGLERLSPLADVAIGGLLIGTILTLVYVPLFAYITDRK